MKKFIYILLASLLLTVLSITTVAQEGPPPLEIEGAQIIATELNLPQGVLVDPDGNVWVIDSGVGGEDEILFTVPGAPEATPSPLGQTARIIMIDADGEQTVMATLPSVVVGMEILGGARLTLGQDGTLYATSGQWLELNGEGRQDFMGAVVSIDAEGTVSETANTWAFEEENNPDGFVADSHPYGLATSPDGWLWVADAGANTVVRVNPETGDVELVATIEGLAGPFPNPARGNEMETDPVPTGVAFDEDGNAYISLLSGFPFLPGSASILQITPEGEVTPYATGLTMLTDVRMGPDGNMYAVQIAMFGEQGPMPNSGAIVRIGEGDTSEVVVSGLPAPTSIDFDADGNAYVTVNGGFGPPGIGALAMFEGLTEMEGTPITEMEMEG